jgi:ribonuclease HI
MITYYTDGRCETNTGAGGFAVIRDMKPHILGKEAESTNIRMEGKALIAALTDAAGQPCEIHTDSEFWINVITKWAPGWQRNGWKKKNGDIRNLDIVQEVFDLYQDSQAKLVWVRGHNKNPGNELADVWANKARAGAVVT